MSVKIRLQRHGKKGKPFYWVVAADARSKRDGRYLEKLGTYNPNTNPATLKIDVDSAVHWLQNGAQPTDTARNLLSEVGAMLKNHLVNGVHKGALKEEDVETKFEAWLADKASRNNVNIEKLSKAKADEKAKMIAAEKEVSEKRKADAEAAIAAQEAAAAAEEAAPEAVAEEAAPEAAAEEAAPEAVAEEAAPEAAAEEAAPEAAAEEAAPEAAAEEAAPEADEKSE
ncbi:MAG: 30S ribosomal protein S16 [Flavobacteriaceae bacterium]|nr:30S ribosomal protein S16 [Flavobacteriaceae bacterium]